MHRHKQRDRQLLRILRGGAAGLVFSQRPQGVGRENVNKSTWRQKNGEKIHDRTFWESFLEALEGTEVPKTWHQIKRLLT